MISTNELNNIMLKKMTKLRDQSEVSLRKITNLRENLGVCKNHTQTAESKFQSCEVHLNKTSTELQKLLSLNTTDALYFNATQELSQCQKDLQLNITSYEQTLEAIKNAPHACKGEWGWASDNIFCPIENEWQSSSMEVKYAVIAGVSVLAIATLGLAGYGVYAYFNPNVIEVAAAPEAMKLYFTASNELKIQIALGYTHHKAYIKMGDLTSISDDLIRDPAQALEFFQQLSNTKQEYIGQIAPHVSEFFHNTNLVGEVNLYLSDLLNNPA